VRAVLNRHEAIDRTSGRRIAITAGVLAAAVAYLLASAICARAITPEYSASFGTFSKPSGVAVDEDRGYVFVADSGANAIEIFDLAGGSPTGLTSTKLEGFAFNGEPTAVAVDNSESSAAGTVYVADVQTSTVKLFVYNGTTEEYEGAGELLASPGFSEPVGVAVDTRGNVYVADYGSTSIVVFDPTGAELGRIETGPYFGPPSSVAVDAAGDVFVEAFEVNAVYKFAANGAGEVEPGTTPTQLTIDSGEVSGVAVDPVANVVYVARGDRITEFDATTLAEFGEFGAGQLSSTERLAVNASTGGVYVADPAAGEVDIFAPPPAKAPEVATLPVGPITSTTAVIGGTVDPNLAATTYFFQYATSPDFSDAVSVPVGQDGVAGSGNSPVHVSRLVGGLSPSTTYFFRLVAQNAEGGPVYGSARGFTTLVAGAPISCPNESFRTGPSAALPDCRAYELVTPADTNAAQPLFGLKGNRYGAFDTLPVSPDGDSVIFNLTGGALPGTNGTGYGDLYKADRGVDGWSTSGVGPSAAQAHLASPAGVADEHEYSFWETQGEGTLAPATYIRTLGGALQLLGDGDIADDPDAIGRWISPGGGHIIFTSQVQLTAAAPAAVGPGAPFFVVGLTLNSPVGAIYDRTPSGLQVVSLLPGDQTPPPGSTTYYRGYSADGSAVVFNVDGTMYVRRNGVTFPIVTTAEPGDVTFEGVSRDGTKVFYLIGGVPGEELFMFDLSSQQSTQISTAADARVVNVSADGSHVYFVSSEALSAGAGSGVANLYVWDGSDVTFIATLPKADEDLWRPGWAFTLGVPEQNNAAGPVEAPSRTNPDGSVIVFESTAALTSYDNEGHKQIYRYAEGEGLTCVSCNPSGAAAAGDALLQGDSRVFGTAPTNGAARIPNVTEDGKAVFFNTIDALVAQDTDGARDVYEWKQGRVSLISYGHSGGAPEWLYGMTGDGHDVLFTSNSGLVPQKGAGALAIYDARVGGGFASPPLPTSCVGDACQGDPSVPGAAPAIGSAQFIGPRNARSPKCKKHRKAKCGCKKQRKKKCKRFRKGKHSHKRHPKSTRRASR